MLRHVIAEVHDIYGGRHAYLLPPTGDRPAAVKKALYPSTFDDGDGYYLVRAPRPDAALDVAISLHRENKPALVATLRGTWMRATIANIVRLQIVAPVAPLMGALWIRVQGVTLWARRVPLTARPIAAQREGRPIVTVDTTGHASGESFSRTVPFVPRPARSRLP